MNEINASDENAIAFEFAAGELLWPQAFVLLYNLTNRTILEHAPSVTQVAIIKSAVLFAMGCVSFLGNIATIMSLFQTRMTRRMAHHNWSAIYLLILHLSIADLIVTIFCMIGEAAWHITVEWVIDEFSCKFFKLMQMFGLYLSTFILVLIGVDRWVAVKYPMKSLRMARRGHTFLLAAYILALLFSMPQFFIFRLAKGPFIEEFYQCATHGTYTAPWQEQFYTTFTFVFTFFIPLAILIVTYLSTFRTISGSEKMFQVNSKQTVYTNKAPHTNRQRLIHKAKMKSLRISVVIIIAFLICWTPYNVMMTIFIFWNPDKKLSDDLLSGIFFFGMSNSLVNPLIYGAFHLCPTKQNNQYTQYSLTRDGSNTYQRSPSMTATTMIDTNGRHTFRRSCYHSTRSSFRNEEFGLVRSSKCGNCTPIGMAGSIHRSGYTRPMVTNGTNSQLVVKFSDKDTSETKHEVSNV